MSELTKTERLILRLFPITYYRIQRRGYVKHAEVLGEALSRGRPAFAKMDDRWYQLKRHRSNRAAMARAIQLERARLYRQVTGKERDNSK